ncbi:mitochondrial peptide methionine sulfoxide reductase-like isoform X3 [Sphaerodactylus townsendi]|nr:mitochondrial peptide methionine sulfoxide reductase-like isoform X3 [Sphaerodactylus townsendi]XP_048357143.1 mitochondrial peptide methionine sulfoxide reductase-like isoform X3 [Sphaerodactylus townsendi]XP_048357144.1 mitochondrial peptide methionine sulfoxide reductase-like isoform X3 [Sphaerodactylus townsendi]XP_048357145.1 mitochondrial peptide methionine sulfoxide reductase-like isoform X3 [Sphaerodactylus townsendi]
MYPPFPEGMQMAMFGMGCFWGAEKKFWQLSGVFSTQVGFSGGFTPNPTYKEVRTGMTGHTEVVRIVFDPQTISYKDLLKVFWENHNPTHGMKQYDDVGTQYRSAIYAFGTEQLQFALRSKAVYEQYAAAAVASSLMRAVMSEWEFLVDTKELTRKQLGRITTEIREAGPFYYAEDYHQQYLHKIPGGFCGLRGTGIPCPVADGEEP